MEVPLRWPVQALPQPEASWGPCLWHCLGPAVTESPRLLRRPDSKVAG